MTRIAPWLGRRKPHKSMPWSPDNRLHAPHRLTLVIPCCLRVVISFLQACHSPRADVVLGVRNGNLGWPSRITSPFWYTTVEQTNTAIIIWNM